MPTKFEEWLKDQPEEVKTNFEEHVSGLRSALQSERDGRKDDLKKLRDLEKLAEKGSDVQKQLAEMTDRLEVTELRAKFYESAPGAGIKNAKAAFLLAQADGLVTKDSINFDGLKSTYPELFVEVPTPKGNAGEGANQENNNKKPDMNNWIRDRIS